MKSFLNKKYHLILIIFVAFFLRFWHLGSNPPSLYVDEVSLGYNAYSILKTARDEYGNFMPLVFRSLDTYNPAFAVYSLVTSIAIFGLNEFAVRFPSALAGTLTVLLTYFLTHYLFKKKSIALISSLLLAISPWHLQFSRFYHEANIMVFFSILGLVLLVYSFKKHYLIYLSAISFGISANTFHGAKLWVPLFMFIILIHFKKEILKFGQKLIPALLILVIFSLPTLFNFQKTLVRPNSVGIFNDKKPFERFVTGYLSHFSPNFLFAQADLIGRHAVPGMGQLYVFELPLILIGLFNLIRQKTRASKFLLAWFLIAPIPAAFATPTPHAGRALVFLPLFSIIASYGLYSMLQIKIAKIAKSLVLILLLVVASYNIITYFHLYYKHYPKEKALDWSDGHKQMVEHVSQVYNDYDSIAISKYYGHPYIYLLFYLKYDPAKYQAQSEDKNSFDKFRFYLSVLPQTTGKTLVITTPQPNAQNVLRQIKMNNGDTVFIAQEIK